MYLTLIFSFFFFNDTATTEIYTLSLHDALPIFHPGVALHVLCCDRAVAVLHRQIAVDPFRRDTSETGLSKSICADVGERDAPVPGDGANPLRDVRRFDGAKGGL